jgi:hypothetical protein
MAISCERFGAIIILFLAYITNNFHISPELKNQNAVNITPANYGLYKAALIQHIISANEAGAVAVDATSAQLLRQNMAQWQAMDMGAAATQFYDTTGNLLYDISSQNPFPVASEEATLWSELKGLWITMNTEFMNANPVGKMLALMQMIGILKCAKWCWTAASDCVLGAIDLGKWSYNMLAGLVSGPLSTTTTGAQDNTVHPNTSNSPNQRFKTTVRKVIQQTGIIQLWLYTTQQSQVQTTLNDILTQITNMAKNATVNADTALESNINLSNFAIEYNDPSIFSGVNKNGTNSDEQYPTNVFNSFLIRQSQYPNKINPDGVVYNQSLFDQFKPKDLTGGKQSKRRPYKSKRRRTKSRSSKKRRHYKTKKRVYRSTRFRTHR